MLRENCIGRAVISALAGLIVLTIVSLPVSLGRPLTALDQIHASSSRPYDGEIPHGVGSMMHDGHSEARKTLEIPLDMPIKGRKMMQEASQSSQTSATAQGGIITSSSAAQVVSDGDGNVKVAGKAESVVTGAVTSQTQASTEGYVSLNGEADGSVEYVVNSASAAATSQWTDSSTASQIPSHSSAQVSGESSTSEDGPDATATHDASATGTLSASEGINTVIISQNKPLE